MTSLATTITVSGYDPIQAYRVVVNSHVLGLTSAESSDLACTHGSAWMHCAPCNKAMRPEHPRRTTLGFALCLPCDEQWSKTCRDTYGRLPLTSEFFCLGCIRILDRGRLCKPDADGRQRWRCQECRTAQVRRAEVRRMVKERAWRGLKSG
jgi:hypothetical protein